jgi:hypothetical protein
LLEQLGFPRARVYMCIRDGTNHGVGGALS